ncbi:DNA-binding transcriptional response regulator, NtrC family, contains REC, AAA-type ATPase, and a Fis-type DNA-binding domains [Pseudarcicella hirudinis]|uniref:DNA-binding transcriptional response regulator, NtrC family, contains REC, AAA-type ATPase, and a Fis-type DNA-binding domains n=1 Tax=Pseudarcicella hirudinis TaxID=1079859 RepID=A0A1I5NW85_9BACT|nr:sigma-54 dependent transcriptional regulator [Pseudarcicella hirudinis]SFP26054.1 DNA-binding transcriptional response regulator, NtrC family, contains REC, AAA-type ATPase, and a Fis-type DNA-binding domains [Pseudarcicella hirudinis]
MNSSAILIIDDEDTLRALTARILELEGYQVFQASDAKHGLKILENETIQLILCDVKLPDANGVELTAILKEKKPFVEIIVLTAYGTISDGVKAIKNGAFDYITKGDDNDKIIPLVSRAMEKALLQEKVHLLEKKVSQQYGFDQIIGHSNLIEQSKTLAQKVAATDTTVLLTGETGTGKEVFSQAIHYTSPRKTNNFVAVNCSAFTKEILESEVFGHKAGAFTGAVKDKKGLVEEADGGTLFLDEIGEMTLDLQAKMLRFLETGTFIKVGDTKTSKVNVRIIAATNRDLEKECQAGTFRLDLFYRLSVFQIKLPSLSERPKDIILLAHTFLKTFSHKTNKRITKMSPEFVEKILSHPWKGNIRELKNVIERAVILTDTDQLMFESLPFDIQYSGNDIHHNQQSPLDLATVEKLHIQKVLALCKGNKTESARLMGIGLTTLYRKIEEYGII